MSKVKSPKFNAQFWGERRRANAEKQANDKFEAASLALATAIEDAKSSQTITNTPVTEEGKKPLVFTL